MQCGAVQTRNESRYPDETKNVDLQDISNVRSDVVEQSRDRRDASPLKDFVLRASHHVLFFLGATPLTHSRQLCRRAN
jgi:hypothetical protein